jgi:hypothetical protein
MFVSKGLVTCLIITLTIKRSNKSSSLFPLYGIGLFVFLYILAASLYPGGSYTDKTTKGFSWSHNYWCELMAPHAQNGVINSARPVAITAMFVLAAGLSIFWYQASGLFVNKNMGHWIIRYPGIFSMLSVLLLFAGPHDMVINISGLSGVIAMCGVMAGLYTNKWYRLFGLGFFCLLLCLINNYIYYGNHFMYYLPVIQKISFIFFLLWFCVVTIHLNKTGIKGPFPRNG